MRVLVCVGASLCVCWVYACVVFVFFYFRRVLVSVFWFMHVLLCGWLVYVCVGLCVCCFMCVLFYVCAGLCVCWFMCVLVYVRVLVRLRISLCVC